METKEQYIQRKLNTILKGFNASAKAEARAFYISALKKEYDRKNNNTSKQDYLNEINNMNGFFNEVKFL